MIDSFAAIEVVQAQHARLAAARKAGVESRPHGFGLDYFHNQFASSTMSVLNDETYDSIRAGRLSRPQKHQLNERIKRFYGLYEGSFPIEAERQPLEGYQNILTKGHCDPVLEHAIDAEHRQFLEILRDPYSLAPVGGLDVVAYAHKEGPPTAHSCFAFLTKENHGLHLARHMFDIRDEIVMRYLHKTNPDALAASGGFYTFAEHNDPTATDVGSYLLDSTTIDPIKRLMIWLRLAYSAIELPPGCTYVQSPYKKGGDPCTILTLSGYFRPVKRSGDTVRLGQLPKEEDRLKEIPANVLYRHLRALCLQNFVKDANAEENDPTTGKMLAQFRAAAMQTLRVTPVAERKAYLELWGGRFKELKEHFGRTKLNFAQLTQTVGELYMQNEADIIDKALARTGQRRIAPSPRELMRHAR